MSRFNFVKPYGLFPLLLFFSVTSTLFAQKYKDLVSLEGYKTKVFFSTGNDVRAQIVAERMDKVLVFYKKIIEFEPDVTLLILGPTDWSNYTNFPVYGMGHCIDNFKTLIIASENNDFWNSFIPPIDQLPKELADKIKATYVGENGELTMQPFFDLLAIHELGHAYHKQAGLNVQRKWMGELFANILLHTYIAENEPESLSALTVFPQMVIGAGKEGYNFITLADIEENYNEIIKKYPKNYGWFQSRWHSAAENIYNSGGVNAFVKLWNSLSEQKETMNDSDFVLLLSEKVDQSVADVILNWDEE